MADKLEVVFTGENTDNDPENYTVRAPSKEAAKAEKKAAKSDGK